MKPSMSPKVVDNAKEFNLTDENLNDFLATYREHMKKTALQKNNYTNFTNSWLDDQSPSQAVNCADYCNSHMRDVFDEYKQYHGYVALVVSINVH